MDRQIRCSLPVCPYFIFFVQWRHNKDKIRFLANFCNILPLFTAFEATRWCLLLRYFVLQLILVTLNSYNFHVWCYGISEFQHNLGVLDLFQAPNMKLRTGIVGIERGIQEKQKATDESISKAFQDLSKLMDMAKDMVNLSKNISQKIRVS